MVVKRIIDIVLCIVAMVVLLPILIILAVIVYTRLGSPILFTQERVGKNGKIFKIIKFRTMINSKNESGELLTDQERLTPIGMALRSTSLDELPELLNVIKGDMSLVGPRPLLVEYITKYNERQFKRHDVFPGITGWAQINGRNSISWNEKFELDVWYVENWSLWLDVKIFVMTLYKVIRRDGINEEGEVTVKYFTGNN